MHFDIFNRKTVSTDKMFFQTTLNPKQAIIIGNGAKFRRWVSFSTNFATFYVIILSAISILLIKSNVSVLICLLLALANLVINRSIPRDRKSKRLNSSHVSISYAVFCLK